MSGMFSAWVVHTLRDYDIYDRVRAVYGTSAGSHAAAYFLSRQIETGASIYREELISGDFLKIKTWTYTKTWLKNIITWKKITDAVINIDYLIEIERSKKVLDTEQIKNSGIDFYVRCVNTETGEVVYLDWKQDTLRKLHASSALIPFYPHSIEIDKVSYCDGSTTGVAIDRELEKLIKHNPDTHIFLVFNNTQTFFNSCKQFILKLSWAILWGIYLKKLYMFRMLRIEHERKKLLKIKKYNNVHIIEPSNSFRFFTTQETTLTELYEHWKKVSYDTLVAVLSKK